MVRITDIGVTVIEDSAGGMRAATGKAVGDVNEGGHRGGPVMAETGATRLLRRFVPMESGRSVIRKSTPTIQTVSMTRCECICEKSAEWIC